VGAWIKKHKWFTGLMLTILIPTGFTSVGWVNKVSGTVCDDYPRTREEVQEIVVLNARMETEIDNCRERIEDLEKNQAEILQAIPRMDTNIEWIRSALENLYGLE